MWALCTVARSGSSWLCELVKSTGCLGDPAEYLLDWPRQAVQAGLSAACSWDEYVELLLRRHVTPNGVFAIKGSCVELQPFLARFPDIPCVWLRREDRCAQAVSWYLAHDGGIWTQQAAQRKSTEDRQLAWSPERARWFYEEILRREQRWHNHFQHSSQPPLVLTYEAVCAAPAEAVRAIGHHVGVSTEHVVAVRSDLHVVRDERSRVWAQWLETSLTGRGPAVGETSATSAPGQ